MVEWLPIDQQDVYLKALSKMPANPLPSLDLSQWSQQKNKNKINFFI